MLAIEIYVNGKKYCTAGHSDAGVVTALIGFVTRLHENGLPKQQITLNVFGLDSQTREHMSWVDNDDLALDDEIILKVVTTSRPDAPLAGSKRRRDEQRQKDYVLRMAKQFGWKVDTSP